MNKKLKSALYYVCAAVLAIAIGLGVSHLIGQSKRSDLEGSAKDITVVSESGKAVKLSDFAGRPVVVNFFATWCGPCKNEMPAFQSAYEEYGDEVVFLMVNLTGWEKVSQNKTDYVKGVIKGLGYSFPLYFDLADAASTAYGIDSIPLTLFINGKGEIVSTYNGSMSKLKLELYIKKIM